MKKLLIPIVALMAFCMLFTSVSANAGVLYYAAHFCGYVSGECRVISPTYEGPGGNGRFCTQGSAIVVEGASGYWAYRPDDPNTLIRLSRTSLRVGWNGETVGVYMHGYRTEEVWFNFRLGEGAFLFYESAHYYGWYMGGARRQFIRGRVEVYFWDLDGESRLGIWLYPDVGPFFYFEWSREAVPRFRLHATIWPI